MEYICNKCSKKFDSKLLIFNHLCENEISINFEEQYQLSNNNISNYYDNNFSIDNIHNSLNNYPDGNLNSQINLNISNNIVNCDICNININLEDLYLHINSYHNNNSYINSYLNNNSELSITSYDSNYSYLSNFSNSSIFSNFYSLHNLNMDEISNSFYLNLIYIFSLINRNSNIILSNNPVLFFFNLNENRSIIREEINKIPIIRYDINNNNEKCSICFNNFNSNEELRLLNCNHYYHINCIDIWLLENFNCPICRKNQLEN